MRYFCKFDDNDKPMILFRADGEIEEVWAKNRWKPAPGFLEDIMDGAFQYGAIEEAAAREYFPEAFDA